MKITDLRANQNIVQQLEILSDNEAINILGGSTNRNPAPQSPNDRNGSSNGCKIYPSAYNDFLKLL